MASSSGLRKVEPHAEAEEVPMPVCFLSSQHFDDFTIASSWERFISEIEAVCRIWMADGPKRLSAKGYGFKSWELPLCLLGKAFDFPSPGPAGCEFCALGKPVDWRSAFHDLQLCFGVKEFLVIVPQSASGAILDAPEASKLLSAVAIALSNCSSLWPAFVPVNDPARKAYIGIQNMGTVFTRRFEADQIGCQCHLNFWLIVINFHWTLKAYSTLDLSTHLFKVQFAMKLTYIMLPYDDDNTKGSDTQHAKCGENLTCETPWDKDCPWREWYSAEDPVKGFELITIWSEKMVESSMEMAELENASPYEAKKWLISPIWAPKLFEGSKWNQIGFASKLRLLVDALKMSFEAQLMENFVSVWYSGSPVSFFWLAADDNSGIQLTDSAYSGHKTSRTIKGAPLESLFAQFCLRSLWFGDLNIRAIAVLWTEFVQEVRWFWEESQLIPRMPANGSVDLSTCLINQKLQMLASCIGKKYEMNEDYQDCIGSEHQMESMDEEAEEGQSPPICSSAPMFAPAGLAASPPPKNWPWSLGHATERIHHHSLGAEKYILLLLPSHHSGLKRVKNFSAQVKRNTLDSAFKAANPDAVFEDFTRRHSPGDVIQDNLEAEMSEDNWPPRGGLSKRMPENRSLWRNIGNKNNTPALPVSEQKPLLDPNREGEKVLNYLETLQPHRLLEQMVCTAFRAAADTVIQTTVVVGDNAVRLVAMVGVKMYPYNLAPFRFVAENGLSADCEIVEDLRRLCVVFQHVETLLTLAASLHRKFLQTPRLAREIFSDFYNFYIPIMGIGLTGDAPEKEFDKKQEVWNQEREVVSNVLFKPTADQSLRKVLSMGNLFNGHEPIKREIIFSLRGVNGNHYTTHASSISQQNFEAYRMYICGMSNDIRVALSVVSCD
ncbi:hypothetical protein Fmac_031328 [Flemingia macrophylla]|uniref:Rab3 GTPase-activating protein catalytic subunit n=1 Tax=Flemingia macrophylla TaxID=520843 RepID=A0ABD1L1T1_9FABA